MIPKALPDIGPDDLRVLIDEQVREGKTIEYKLELPGAADREKARFLASVSSLANTAGGDHLFGGREAGGLPVEFPGVESVDPDADVLRMEQMLANGLEPRLPLADIRPIEVANGRYVFVLRVPKSWISPHRVRQNGKFYGRNSAGKYELDVAELRTAFTLSESVEERIRRFRADRVAKVYGRETPVPLKTGGVLVLHLLPLSGFVEHKPIDLSRFEGFDQIIRPMGGARGLEWHVNLDGFVAFEVAEWQGGCGKYTQVFRSGSVEATLVISSRDGDMALPSIAFEVDLINLLARFIELAPKLGINAPVYVFLSMVGVRGCRLNLGAREAVVMGPRPLSQDVALLPEVVLEDFEIHPGRSLRPVFDVVWNAFGMPRSLNYDAEGNWRQYR